MSESTQSWSEAWSKILSRRNNDDVCSAIRDGFSGIKDSAWIIFGALVILAGAVLYVGTQSAATDTGAGLQKMREGADRYAVQQVNLLFEELEAVGSKNDSIFLGRFRKKQASSPEEQASASTPKVSKEEAIEALTSPTGYYGKHYTTEEQRQKGREVLGRSLLLNDKGNWVAPNEEGARIGGWLDSGYLGWGHRLRGYNDKLLANDKRYIEHEYVPPGPSFSSRVEDFTKDYLVPAGVGVSGVATLLGSSGLFHKKPPTFMEHLTKNVSDITKSLYGVPLLAATTVGGLGLGYMGLSSLLSASRERNRKRRLAEAKRRFETALSREQQSKVGAALEEFVTTCEQELLKKEGDFSTSLVATLGTAGLAALAIGAVNGYQSDPDSIRKLRELRRVRQEQLAARLERERKFRVSEPFAALSR